MITVEFLRHYRIFGYAIFDLSISFLGIGILSPILSRIFLFFRIIIPKKNWLFLTLPIGIIAHILTGNHTLMTKNFIDPYANYILKILIVGLFILGMRGIGVGKKNRKHTL